MSPHGFARRSNKTLEFSLYIQYLLDDFLSQTAYQPRMSDVRTYSLSNKPINAIHHSHQSGLIILSSSSKSYAIKVINTRLLNRIISSLTS